MVKKSEIIQISKFVKILNWKFRKLILNRKNVKIKNREKENRKEKKTREKPN
jgi:hypothetical protein